MASFATTKGQVREQCLSQFNPLNMAFIGKSPDMLEHFDEAAQQQLHFFITSACIFVPISALIGPGFKVAGCSAQLV